MTIPNLENKIIFEYSQKNRRAGAHFLKSSENYDDLPDNLLRHSKPLLPEVSELAGR